MISNIFQKLFNPATGQLSRNVVYFSDIVEAANEVNATRAKGKVSTSNPANFFKDLTRRVSSSNKHWPKEVLSAGFTATQLTGDSRSFEFVPLRPGQTVPFTEILGLPATGAAVHPISTVSVPLPVRDLARSDEPFLLQLAVRLRLIETHMGLFSSMRKTIRQIDHLQNSVKLRRSEIDAVFLAVQEDSTGRRESFLISCEAKRKGEDVTGEQLIRQPLALFSAMPDYDMVVPLVVRSLGKSKIQIAEFAPFRRGASPDLRKLTDGVYDLLPAIKGL